MVTAVATGALADSVLRLQRRDHYRLKLGRAGSLHCQLALWLSDARRPPPPCTGASAGS